MEGEDGSGDRILTAEVDKAYEEKVGLTGVRCQIFYSSRQLRIYRENLNYFSVSPRVLSLNSPQNHSPLQCFDSRDNVTKKISSGENQLAGFLFPSVQFRSISSYENKIKMSSSLKVLLFRLFIQ